MYYYLDERFISCIFGRILQRLVVSVFKHDKHLEFLDFGTFILKRFVVL